MGLLAILVLVTVPLFIAGVLLLLLAPVSGVACLALVALAWWLFWHFSAEPKD